MKIVPSRGGVLLACLAISISAAGEETRTPTATSAPSGPTPTVTPVRTAEAPPPDAGLMKPSPSPTAGRASRPIRYGDCAEQGWRSFSSPRFDSQKACELWVRKHPSGGEPRESRPPTSHSDDGGQAVRTDRPVRA